MSTSNPLVVFGSVNMDFVVYSKSAAQVGQTVSGTKFRMSPGGKGANQAVAAARLGAPLQFVGTVGQDYIGTLLMDALRQEQIGLGLMQQTGEESGTAFISVYEDSGDNSIVVIMGANRQTQSSQVPEQTLRAAEVVVSQMEVPVGEVQRLFERAKSHKCVTVLNTAPASGVTQRLLADTDIIVLNETELAELSGLSLTDSSVEPVLRNAIDKLGMRQSQAVLVTLGRRGVLCYERGSSTMLAGHAVTAVDTTGSGDCFVGALAAQLVNGKSLLDATEFANRAASLAVTREGALRAMPYMQEVLGA